VHEQGYRGRTGDFEILILDDPLKRLILKNVGLQSDQ